jgi:imidazolonepropionase-like amidohydrolase
VASGPPLTSVGGHCHFLGGEVANRAQISAAVRERVQRGVDVVKVMASGGMTTPGTDVMGTQFSADEMHLLVGLAHEAGLPITAHAHSLAAVEQSVDAGADCIEHCSCAAEKGSVLSEELVASIADRDIAISGVLNPNPQMDLSQAPPAIRKLIAATGWTPQRIHERRG